MHDHSAQPDPLHATRTLAKLTHPALAALLALANAGPAQAARPLNTDDARIVDPGACQLESWARSNRDSTELWALPGCNFSGNLELTLGGARLHDAGGSHTMSLVLQGKTVIKPLTTNSWGWAAALGGANDPGTGSRDVYVYLPVSLSLMDDRAFLHLNLGAKREGVEHRKQLTWGLAAEHQISDRVGLIGETFAQDKGRPFAQLGMRYWVIRDQVQIDTTAGNRLSSGAGERWFSIGLRLLSPPFLP